MELDQYKVHVIHFVNPHLIWALVHKEGDENTFYFEQIGIYGILPQNVTFGEDCVVKSEPCEQWMPAASVAMRRSFLEADHVMFSPTYIDKKSSIFDDNSHKYGTLIVVKKNGAKVNVLREIVNSEFAYEDECLFLQKLTSNQLDTKLNYVTIRQVMKKIEEAHKTREISKKKWLDILKNQTSVLHEQKDLESSIMSRKLEVQDRGDADSLIQLKVNVLKLCKDVDEVSVGRACSTRKSPTQKPPNISSIITRKLQWLESQSIANKPKEDQKLAVDDSAILPKSASMHANHTRADMKTNNDVFEDEQNNNAVSPKHKNHVTRDGKKTNIKKGVISRKIAATKSIAFGPEGLTYTKFAIKEQTTTQEQEEPVMQEKPEPEPEYEAKKNQDVYANTDSERENFRLLRWYE